MLLGFDPPTSSTQIQKFQKTVVVVVSSHFSPGNRGWGKPQKSRPSEPYDNKKHIKKKHHKRPSFETAPCQYSCDLAILAWAHPRPSTSKSTPGKVSQCKGSFHRSAQNDVLTTLVLIQKCGNTMSLWPVVNKWSTNINQTICFSVFLTHSTALRAVYGDNSPSILTVSYNMGPPLLHKEK